LVHTTRTGLELNEKSQKYGIMNIGFYFVFSFFSFLFSPFIICLHDHNKSGCFGGLAFSSQSGPFENFLDCSNWQVESRPSKKATFVLIM